MRHPRTSALLVLLSLLAGCNSDSQQLLDQAESRWRDGNYEDAIRLNLLLYDRDPKGKYAAKALLNIGNIYYLNSRQLNKAIESYQKLVTELPGRPEEYTAREQLAAIYANEIGDLTQAIYEYERILASKDLDNRAEIQYQKANAYFKLNDFDRALREMRRIEEEGVTGHLADQVFLKIGSVYLVRKRFEDAVEPFEKVAASPCIECRRRALLNLMETHEALYDFDRAIEAIQRLDRTPENNERIVQEVARITAKREEAESRTILHAPTTSTTKAPRHQGIKKSQ